MATNTQKTAHRKTHVQLIVLEPGTSENEAPANTGMNLVACESNMLTNEYAAYRHKRPAVSLRPGGIEFRIEIPT